MGNFTLIRLHISRALQEEYNMCEVATILIYCYNIKVVNTVKFLHYRCDVHGDAIVYSC